MLTVVYTFENNTHLLVITICEENREMQEELDTKLVEFHQRQPMARVHEISARFFVGYAFFSHE